jgi:hypothetical protein
MKYINYTVLIALIIGLIWFLINQRQNFYRKLENLEQITSNNNDIVLNLTKKEFKKSDSLLKSKLDSLNVKIKHVERVYTNTYHHIYDSTKTVLITKENNVKSFNHVFDSCLSVSGRVSNDSIFFDKTELNYNSETFYFWKRTKKIFFIPFGRKKHFVKTLNNCTGKTHTKEIIIKKNMF